MSIYPEAQVSDYKHPLYAAISTSLSPFLLTPQIGAITFFQTVYLLLAHLVPK